MKRVLSMGIALAATVALAACGSDNSSDVTTPNAAGSAGKTVSVKQVDGVGNILVDSGGMALYASDQESAGKVLCDKGCLSFWKPLKAGASAPTTAADAGKLTVVKRPDGTRQVASNGKLLYTFADDSPGKVKGNGFKDDFDGQHFTWHAVMAGGTPAGSSAGGGESGGYGSGGGSKSSNYGY
jgi:predicted lipoprotein with Yx(FWY)xxD motif